MDKKDKKTFTNESLSKKFKSNFELVTYAISLAENMIKTGRDVRVKSDTQNKAMLILEEINEGKDYFDEVGDYATHSSSINNEPSKEVFTEEKAERRKYKTAEIHNEEL